MTDIRVEQSDNLEILNLGGDLTVASANDFKGAILSALKRADTVVVNLHDVVDADVALLQVLCSAHRAAIRLHKQFSVSGAEQEAFGQTLARSGFSRHIGCKEDAQKTCLWISR